MHIHGSALAVEVISPNFIQKLIPRENSTLILQKQTQKVKFLQRQHHLFAAYFDGILRWNNTEAADIKGIDVVILTRLLCAAQKSFDSRYQLHHSERLCHIIIRAHIKPHDLIVFRALGGQHHHRDVLRFFVGSQIFKHCKPVTFGKHYIKDNEICIICPKLSVKFTRFFKSVCRKSRIIKSVYKKLSYTLIVLNKINHIFLLSADFIFAAFFDS